MQPADDHPSEPGPSEAEPRAYEYVTFGRNRRTLYTVLAVWLFCLIAGAWFDIAYWIRALVLLATLPALYDLWANPRSGVVLDGRGLSWFSGQAVQEPVPLSVIDHVRLVTRVDFAVGASVVQRNSGTRLRLPPHCTPPAAEFEAALTEWGVATQKHHFTRL